MSATKVNLVGRRFGSRVVLSFEGINASNQGLWKVRCDCGAESIVARSALNPNKGKFCAACRTEGMRRERDLTGETFGEWTVEGFAGNHPKTKAAIYNVRCSCGAVRRLPATTLLTENSKQCKKCKHAKHRGEPGQSGLSQLISNYSQGAKVRQLVWTLSRAQAKLLFEGNCHYCGAPPSLECYPKTKVTLESRTLGKFVYNGIDRVDNSLGYVTNNVVACCKTCNMAKHSLTQEEFLAWAKRLAQHQKFC